MTITLTPPPPAEPLVIGHHWRGYRCASRLVHSTDPRLAPVVLIGGAFQTKESWGRIERGLTDHADLLAVDLPGWGAGEPLPERFGADFMAEALCHMLDELGLPRVNVVAGSYGTAVAYLLAQRCPERVEKMVLAGTMTSIPSTARAAMQHTVDLLTAGRTTEFAEATAALLVNPERLDAVTRGSQVRRFLIRRMTSLTPDEIEQHLTNTRRLLRHQPLDPSCPPAAPVLVTTGEHDGFTTPELCRELAATCADSWFARVADADHMLLLERPDELVDLILRFLSGRPLAGLPYCRSVERVSPTPAKVVGPRGRG
ncbi:alpha/beta fold hydrolase [Kitasatospora viridis]|uniref:Pimeloyl-ACP methyl ester carboxylesterase n=1 Tax=Kitasatospora viridis TaxID=281105 RepID=A0A561T7E2_9ACTN|nr:alpha/beta hydrolase [Kitasatospora viridis]TWF83027.1 pimeloyl-ACP methyl ester carboxylesterase [Kitasatospora viridis]